MLKVQEFIWKDGSGDTIAVRYDDAEMVSSFITGEKFDVDFTCGQYEGKKVRKMIIEIAEDIQINRQGTDEVIYVGRVAMQFPVKQNPNTNIRVLKK